MSEPPPLELVTCPHCGAECDARASRCWLCYGHVADRNEVVDAELVEPPRDFPGDAFFAVMSAVLAVLLLAVAVGAAFSQPGLLVLMAIVVVPALMAVFVRSQRKQRLQGRVGWGERLATFLVSASLMIGILGLVAVGLLVTLFVFCIIAITGGGGFH